MSLGFGESDFDYLHMPMTTDIGQRLQPLSLGYVFVNCVRPEIASKVVARIFGHDFGMRRGSKPVHAGIAKVQGAEANMQHVQAVSREKLRSRGFSRRTRFFNFYRREGTGWALVQGGSS